MTRWILPLNVIWRGNEQHPLGRSSTEALHSWSDGGRVSSLAQHVVLVTQRVHWSHLGPCFGCPHQPKMDFSKPRQIALAGLSQMVWRQHQGSRTSFFKLAVKAAIPKASWFFSKKKVMLVDLDLGKRKRLTLSLLKKTPRRKEATRNLNAVAANEKKILCAGLLVLVAFEPPKDGAGALCSATWPAGIWCRAVPTHQQQGTLASRDGCRGHLTAEPSTELLCLCLFCAKQLLLRRQYSKCSALKCCHLKVIYGLSF